MRVINLKYNYSAKKCITILKINLVFVLQCITFALQRYYKGTTNVLQTYYKCITAYYK